MTPPAYIVITPVRNEQAHFPETIASMVAQTTRPRCWVIVDDGSQDATGTLADQAAGRHPWIRVVHRPDRGSRQPGGGVIKALYDGYPIIETQDWDFLVKLDGDLSFPPDYFERCLEQFAAQPKLGIAGGTICRPTAVGVEVDSKGDPSFHVRGATKIYRRTCWKQIAPLAMAPGWDTVDELKANRLGWKTATFANLKILQHKETGSADGAWRNWVKNGLANYMAGYHPLFMLAKCLRRAAKPPVLTGACGLFWGFCGGYLRRLPPAADAETIRYVRRQQINRLTLRPSLWS